MSKEGPPRVVQDGLPQGRIPLLPEWHNAWVEGDRMMPVSTPNTIPLGLAVLRSIRDDGQSGQTLRNFLDSDFDNNQLAIEAADAIKRHNELVLHLNLMAMPRQERPLMM